MQGRLVFQITLELQTNFFGQLQHQNAVGINPPSALNREPIQALLAKAVAIFSKPTEQGRKRTAPASKEADGSRSAIYQAARCLIFGQQERLTPSEITV